MKSTSEIDDMIKHGDASSTAQENVLNILSALNEQIAAINARLDKLERHEGVTVWNCDSPNKP